MLEERSLSKHSWERFLKGVGANALGQAVTVLIQVISVPLFIRFWGVELYGEWLILVSIPTYLALSDLGFGSAASNEMTLRVAQDDRPSALTIFQTTWLLISAIAVGCILLITAIVWGLPITHWLNFTHINSTDAAGIVLLMSLEVFMSQQVVLSVAGYQCEGNYPAGIFHLHLIRLLAFIAVGLAIVLGARPVGVALIYVCATALGALTMGLNLHRRSPWLAYGYRHADLKVLKKLSLPAIAFMGFPLASALSNQGMTLIIGTLLSPVAVVVFSTQRTLSRLVWQILNLITNSVKPELSIAFGQGNLKLARQLHHKACKAALWLALLTAGGLALSGHWIVGLWTNGRVLFDADLFHIMLGIIVVNSLWNTSQAVPMAVNQHQQIALRYVIGSGITVFLATQLTPLWGTRGAAASLLAIDIVMSFYVVQSSLKLLNENFPDFARNLITPPTKISRLLYQKKQ